MVVRIGSQVTKLFFVSLSFIAVNLYVIMLLLHFSLILLYLPKEA